MNNNGITILNENSNNTDFAVLELSTKAVKLLIGPQKKLVNQSSFTFRNNHDDFNFRHFYRTAEKPETGKGLNSNLVMDMNYFNRRVIRSIKKMMIEINRRDISKVVCVATAAYRKAKNQNEILDAIQTNCGISVKVLSKKEEAVATYFAFMNSKPDWMDKDESLILIDQGGGSIEISFFNEGDMQQTHSLGIGTTDIQQELLKNIPSDSESLEEGFLRCLSFSHSYLRDMYLKANTKGLFDVEFMDCVAVGTAITKSSGKKGNAKQHCFEMSKDFMKDKINKADILFKELNITTTSDLKEFLDSQSDFHGKGVKIHEYLTIRLGLPMIIEILERFDLDSLMISGTGLWYGVYFQEIYKS